MIDRIFSARRYDIELGKFPRGANFTRVGKPRCRENSQPCAPKLGMVGESGSEST